MVLVVGHALAGAVVAGGDDDGDAQQGRLLRDLIEAFHRLIRPRFFGIAPADGEDGRCVQLIVDGGAESILKTARGVGGEVNGQRCAVCDGPGNLDVEHHFSIGAVGGGGTIVGVIDEDGADRRNAEVEAMEVLLEVGRPVATAQFDDPDGLAVTVGIGGKVIQRGDLERSVGGG